MWYHLIIGVSEASMAQMSSNESVEKMGHKHSSTILIWQHWKPSVEISKTTNKRRCELSSTTTGVWTAQSVILGGNITLPKLPFCVLQNSSLTLLVMIVCFSPPLSGVNANRVGLVG